MKKLMIIICLSGICRMVIAQPRQQTKYPNVGEAIPDHTFTDLVNFPAKTVSVSDFRGKWLLIDIWGYSCGACIASFPKMNKISNDFKDKVQLIMVGATKGSGGTTPVKVIEKITKDRYSKLEKRLDLKFTVAFDSVLFGKFDVGSVPQILVIDPMGIIKAKVSKIDSADLAILINGGMPDFKQRRSYSASEPFGNSEYSKQLPLLTNGMRANGGVDTSFLFRSLLILNTDEMPFRDGVDINLPKARGWRDVSKGGLEVFGFTIPELYRTAYFGVTSWDEWDTAYYDSHFQPLITEIRGKIDSTSLYSYSLKVPMSKANRDLVMDAMQRDLKNYFGYNVRVEVRNMPVLSISIADEKKISHLKSTINTNTPYKVRKTKSGVRFENIPFKRFINIIIAGLYRKIPVLDITNLKENIDVDYDVDVTDPDDGIRALKKLGFKVEKGYKTMKVIVLSK